MSRRGWCPATPSTGACHLGKTIEKSSGSTIINGRYSCAFLFSSLLLVLHSPRRLAQREVKTRLAELSLEVRPERLLVAQWVLSWALGPARSWAERCRATVTITATIAIITTTTTIITTISSSVQSLVAELGGERAGSPLELRNLRYLLAFAVVLRPVS